jgi:hypothetical protein
MKWVGGVRELSGTHRVLLRVTVLIVTRRRFWLRRRSSVSVS